MITKTIYVDVEQLDYIKNKKEPLCCLSQDKHCYQFGVLIMDLKTFFWKSFENILDLQHCVSCRLQQRGLVIHMYVYISFLKKRFHYSLLKTIEYSSLCYTVNLSCLFWKNLKSIFSPTVYFENLKA